MKSIAFRINEDMIKKYEELLDRPGVLEHLQNIGGRRNSGKNTLYNLVFEKAYASVARELEIEGGKP